MVHEVLLHRGDLSIRERKSERYRGERRMKRGREGVRLFQIATGLTSLFNYYRTRNVIIPTSIT